VNKCILTSEYNNNNSTTVHSYNFIVSSIQHRLTVESTTSKFSNCRATSYYWPTSSLNCRTQRNYQGYMRNADCGYLKRKARSQAATNENSSEAVNNKYRDRGYSCATGSISVLIRLRMWLYDHFFAFFNTARGILYDISLLARGRHCTAAALAQFPLSERICFFFRRQ